MGLKHLLSLKDLKRGQIEHLIQKAFDFKNGKSVRLDRNVYVAPLFMEPSTRTMLSFETAAKNLGLNVLNFNPSGSSTVKGETLFDTLKTMESLGTEVAIVRLKEEGLLREITAELNLSVINAGEGITEHPTQALLDAMTIQEHFGKVDGLVVSIIGDIKHSRVASSFIDFAKIFNITLKLFSPIEFGEFEHELKSIDYQECLEHSDVVICLRNQLERHEKQFISTRDYNIQYGINHTRIRSMKSGSILMHPGPFNRGVELDAEILKHESVKIWNQVNNGVFARMAVLHEVLNG